ncbi:MAG: hypothetical protein ABI574_08090 [Burkholderiales bacterium]
MSSPGANPVAEEGVEPDGEGEPAGASADLGWRPPNFATRALTILWPSFVMAGVLEMLVFAVIDPADLHWFGGEPVEWSKQAVYTVTFVLFWGAISLAGAVSALLALPAELAPRRSLVRRWP